LNHYTIYITLYDLALLGTVLIALVFGLMLFVSGKGNRAANRWLGLIMVVLVWGMLFVLLADMGWESIFPPCWMGYLALGPLIGFYVRSIVEPGKRFNLKSWLHFWPAFAGLTLYVLGWQAKLLGITQFGILTFVSVCWYLIANYRLTKKFLAEQQFTGMDRYRLKLGWLSRVLRVFAAGWLLWIPLVLATCFFEPERLGLLLNFLNLGLNALGVCIAGTAILHPENHLPAFDPYFLKVVPRDEFKQKAAWLKKELNDRAYYRDPELS